MTYVMESGQEGARLAAQAEADAVTPRLLAAGLGPGQTVLDAGCGPGVITQAIAEIVGPQGKVVAIDINLDLLETVLEGLPTGRSRLSDPCPTG